MKDILLRFLKPNKDISAVPLFFLLPVVFVKWSHSDCPKKFSSLLSNIGHQFSLEAFKAVYMFLTTLLSLHKLHKRRALSIYLLLEIIFPRTFQYKLHIFDELLFWFELNLFTVAHFRLILSHYW